MNSTLVTQVISATPEATLVRITGEARLVVDSMERELMRVMLGRPKLVVLDMSGFTFCSSLGMGILVSFRRGVVQTGGRIVLCAMPPDVLESFRRARLHDLFEICDSLQTIPGFVPPPAPSA
jgi:anti-anti-sigma factor